MRRVKHVDPAWVASLVALATAAASIAVWAARWVWRIMRRTSRFMDDYFGEPPSGGNPGKPGVMARLGNLENMVRDIGHEVHLNSGHSMRDTVQRTERKVEEMQRDVKRLDAKVTNLHGGTK